MNGGGKSDSLVVAEKPSNKDWGAPQSAERVEPRGLAKGNSLRRNRFRTQCRAGSEYGRLQTGTKRETAETAKRPCLR